MRGIEDYQGNPGNRFKRSIEVLKGAVPLSEYAGELTELKSAGGDRLVGRCPIHEEKTPSFFVYEDGHFHCYGCEAHGDVLDLFMAVEEIPEDPGNLGTALAELAHLRGVELPGRSEAWHEATVRKAEIEDLAMRACGQVYKRRAFRLLVWPEVEAATSGPHDLTPEAREREFERAYAEFGSPERWERYAAQVLKGSG